VETSQQYSAAETERMMKLQDVLLKAMAKKITWWEAAEIIGVTARTMRRWRERLEKEGYSGLVDRRKNRPSDRRVPRGRVEEVLRLYRETYAGLNIRHFQEKLREEHGIPLSYTWVQKALQGAGLVARGRKRRTQRRRRERRPMPGMLLHIDGSKHQWFGDERWYDLIVILDDATSEVYYAQLVEEESTRTVMAALREVIETQGLFCALYMFVIVVVPLIGVDIRNHSMIVKVALSVSARAALSRSRATRKLVRFWCCGQEVRFEDIQP